MSRFDVKRSYKQLMAERNALEYFIAHKKATTHTGELTVGQVAELCSHEALLKEINQDIERAREVLQRDYEDVYGKVR